MTNALVNVKRPPLLTHHPYCAMFKGMDFLPLINRTLKRYRQLRKWSRRTGVTCYRIYDRDIPEFPMTIDLYELLPKGITSPASAASFVAEQEHRISQNEAHITQEITQRQYLVISIFDFPNTSTPLSLSSFIAQHSSLIASALSISSSHVIIKTRKRGKGGSRYADYENANGEGTAQVTGTVYESGLLFKVKLTGHIDTGLFLDHRPLRSMIRKEAQGLRVLNLYCYTAAFSAAAAAGMAKAVISVDLSNTYLDWAKCNMKINGFDGENYIFIKSDVTRYLNAQRLEGAQYGLIILDPPTFSNSQSAPMLDLNKDYPNIVSLCIQLLAPRGVLYFSTNSRRLRVCDGDIPKGWKAEDITNMTIPPDFPLHKAHHTWRITSIAPRLL